MGQPKYEFTVPSLQWHKGFMDMGRGFDQKMLGQVDEMGRQSFAIVAALTQPDPTWFTLFCQRQTQ